MAAKKKTTKKPEAFDTGCIPAPCRTLTPERAKQWLKVDYDHWQIFASRVAEGGADVSWLHECLSHLVEACTCAMETGRPVRLFHSLEQPKGLPSWHTVVEPLELIAAALRKPLDDEYQFNNMIEPIAALLGGVLAIAQRADAAETE